MKKLILVLLLSSLPLAVWAACTTHTIISGGRILTCTTCCNGGYCTTNCI